MSAQIAERLERVRSFGERRFALGPGVVWSYNSELGVGLSFPLQRLGYRVRLSGPTGSVEAFLTYVNPTAQEKEAYFLFPLDADVVPLKVRGKVGEVVLESKVCAAPHDDDGDDVRDILPLPLATLFQTETERIMAISLGMVPPGSEISFQILFACFVSESSEEGVGFSFRLPLLVSQSLTSLKEEDAEYTTLANGLERGAQVAVSLQLEASDLDPGRLVTSQPCSIARTPDGDIAVELDRKKTLEARDFVFDYQLWKGNQPKAWLRSQGRHFLLNFLPPVTAEPSFPRRIVFLIDGSEEMKRVGVERVHSCIEQVLKSLSERDRFALVAFNRDVGGFKNGDFVEPVLASEALGWLKEFDFTGVADLKALLGRVVTLPRQPDSVLSVVILAAGRLGNEPELYRILQGARENLRLVPVLLGRKADTHFARAASKLTGGKAFRALTEDSISRVAERIVEETRQSVLEVVGLQDRGLGFQGDSLTPKYPCGLSAYRPINILGLHTGQGGVEAGGKVAGGGAWSEVVPIKPVFHKFLPAVWAQVKAQELDDEARMLERSERNALKSIVQNLSEEYGLGNSFTALVVQTNRGGEPRFGPSFEPWRWIKAIERASTSNKPASELLEEQKSHKGLKGGRNQKIAGRGLRMKETLGSKKAPAIFGSKLGHENKLSAGVKEGLFSKPMLKMSKDGADEPRATLRSPIGEPSLESEINQYREPPKAEEQPPPLRHQAQDVPPSREAEEISSESVEPPAPAEIEAPSPTPSPSPVSDQSPSPAAGTETFRPVIRASAPVDSLDHDIEDSGSDELSPRQGKSVGSASSEATIAYPSRPILSTKALDEEPEEEEVQEQEEPQMSAASSRVSSRAQGGPPVIGSVPPVEMVAEPQSRPVSLRTREPESSGGFVPPSTQSTAAVSPESQSRSQVAEVQSAPPQQPSPVPVESSPPALPSPRDLAAKVDPRSRQGPPEVQAREALKADPVVRKALMAEMKQLHVALGKTNDLAILTKLTDGVLGKLAEVAPRSELLVRAYALGYQSRGLLQQDLGEAKKKLAFWLSRFAKLF